MYLTIFQFIMLFVLVVFVGWLTSGWLKDRAFEKGRSKGYQDGVEHVTKVYGIVLPEKPKPFKRHGDL